MVEWPYTYIGRILLTLAISSRVDTRAYPKHGAFRSLGGPDSFFLTKLECWWVAHWWPSQIRVPIMVTNVSQRRQLCGSVLWYWSYKAGFCYSTCHRAGGNQDIVRAHKPFETLSNMGSTRDHAPVWCAAPSLAGGVLSGTWGETYSVFLAC